MAKSPAQMMAEAQERQWVFNVRSRYYTALRAGLPKKMAEDYANNPEATLPEDTVKSWPTKPPKQEPPKEKVQVAPEVAQMPEAPPVHEHAEPVNDNEKENPFAGDDLTKLNGVGPGTVRMLKERDVVTFKQIADWTDEDVERFDDDLGLRGRIKREKWVDQAKKLSE